MIDSFIYFVTYYWYLAVVGIIGSLLLRRYFLIIFLVLIFCVAFYLGGTIEDSIILLVICAIISLFRSDKRREKEDKDSPFRVEILTDKGKTMVIKNVNAGVSIFAASGGGKSVGPIYWLAKHFAKKEFAGIINDYKNYELTEVVYPLFKEVGVNVSVWAPHDVNRSVRVNPISPRYINTESDLQTIINSLMMNLFPNTGGDSAFFVNAAASAFCAVAWRLKESYPEKCNIPFIISLLLSYESLHEEERPYGKLIDFITKSPRATVIGNMFLSGTGSERQTGAVMSSLADGLAKLASPEIFYLLGADEYNLAVNADDTRSVLCVVNYPKKESNITPVNAMIMECAMSSMSERGRKPSFIMLDEAPTIKLEKLGKKVSTLRSYGISFIYCLQDKIQGSVQNNGKDYIFKEILANLSVQFMGKINDPDTGKYYEKFFELVKEEQKSFNKAESTIMGMEDGGARVNTSFKDVSKFRAHEFFLLKAGEFVMFSAGEAKKFRFKYEQPVGELPLPLRQVTASELDRAYENLLSEGADFLSNI